MGAQQEAVLRRAWVNTVNSLQKQRWDNINELKNALGDIGDGVKKRFDALIAEVKDGKLDEREVIQRLSTLTREIKSFAGKIGFDIDGALQKQLADIYADSYYRTAWQLDIASPNQTAINFAMLSEDQIRAAISTPFKGAMFSDRLFAIGDETARLIQKDVTQGILLGRPIEATAAEIYDKFGDEGTGYFWRAQLISRTETIRARELARQELYRQNSDIIAEERWVCMESAFVDDKGKPHECEICAPLDDTVTELEPIVDTHPNCFLHHGIKITTENGEKDICKIKVGDKVLTHLGRYKPVVSVTQSKKRYIGDAIRITFKGRQGTTYDESKGRNCVTTTPEHPYLTGEGWKTANQITEYDNLFVQAKQCPCGEIIPYWKNYCSMECQLTHETRKKISLSKMGKKNSMWGKFGSLNGAFKGGSIHRYVSGWDYIRQIVLSRDGYRCRKCGLTQEEHFKKYGYDLHIHHISPYRQNKDSAVSNLVTLCASCHKKIEGTDNKDVLNSGGALFIRVPIVRVEYLKGFKGEKRYNFEVEEDHSYVAKGIVVHNCVCTKRAVLKPWEELEGGDSQPETEAAYQPYDEWLSDNEIDISPEV